MSLSPPCSSRSLIEHVSMVILNLVKGLTTGVGSGLGMASWRCPLDEGPDLIPLREQEVAY